MKMQGPLSYGMVSRKGAAVNHLRALGMFLRIVWRYDPFTDRKMRLSTAWRVARVMHL